MTWLPDATLDRLREVAETADWPVVSSGRYDAIAVVGRGGMGTVYRARDRELQRDVAMKVLSASTTAVEAVILARLEHPGIVPIHDAGFLEDGRVFYVMKLVQGRPLDEHAAERPLAERLRLFTRICEPLAFAHVQSIVHRDLKPDNVMIGPFGEVLVMDWGVAATGGDLGVGIRDSEGGDSEGGDSEHGNSGAIVVGTRAYMAPEQARGEAVDQRADVHGLGGILYFLLTGAPPEVRPLRGPRALQAICRKARAPLAVDRYGSVQALAADVECFLAGEPVSASPERALERLARFTRKHRSAIVMIAAYLVLRVLIAWLAP